MNIVIIEDEILTADDLSQTIQRVLKDARITAVLHSVKNAVQYFEINELPDLIFSDIQLGDGLSFEIFSRLNINVPVIFCTAFDEYALEAFKANGIEYILKPFTRDSINTALQRYLKLEKGFVQKQKSYTEILAEFKNGQAVFQRSLIVHFKDKIIPVKTEDIALFYTEHAMVSILLFNGIKYTINKSLEELEENCGSLFFRVNRQYLVNRKAILDLSNYLSRKLVVNINIAHKEAIIISREKTSVFLKWLADA